MDNTVNTRGEKIKHERDWTKGSIVFNLLSLSWPVLVSQSLDISGPLIDMIWVGKLGAASVAGVGIAGIIVILANSSILGLSVGVKAVVARLMGAGDREGAVHASRQAFVVGVGFYIVIAAIGIFLAEPILAAFGVEPEVVSEGAIYLRIMFIGAITMSIWMIAVGAMQASGDTVTPMKISLVFRAVHIISCPFLVFGWWIFPQMGVSGAAVANAIAQTLAMVLGLWVLFSGRTRLHLSTRNFYFDPEVIWRMVKIGIPNLFMHVQHHLGSLAMVWLMAPFGTVALAAHTIWQRTDAIVIILGMGVGISAGVLGAQNIGAGQPERAVKTGWIAAGMATVIMVIILAVVLLWAEVIVSIFSTDPEMVKTTATFMRIAAASYLAMAFNSVFLQFLVGVGDTVPTLVIEMFQAWIVQLPLAFLLPRYTDLGVYGVRWAIVIAIIVAGILFTLYFHIGKWKHKNI